ncbi:hypothetical protein [Anabaena azotica]|nr:hypothetical protein [Anabaena azotica]
MIPIQNSSWKVSYGGKPLRVHQLQGRGKPAYSTGFTAYRTFRKIQNSS